MTPMPRWLGIISALVLVNTFLVGASLIHRRLWAQETPSLAAELVAKETSQDETTTPPSKSVDNISVDNQQKLRQLPPPALGLNPYAQQILQDDPLLKEIQRQADHHFPLPSLGESTTAVSMAALATQSENVPVQRFNYSLPAIGHLTAAAGVLARQLEMARGQGDNDRASILENQLNTIRQLLAQLVN
jgi:hypothetical protein